MNKQEIIKAIKEQHEEDLTSLLEWLERNLPDDLETPSQKCPICGSDSIMHVLKH